MHKIIGFLRRNLPAQIIASLLFLFLSVSLVRGVTTISTNITTDGMMRATTTADTVLRLSNSTGTNDIFKLFDNTTQIFNVADGGVASGTTIRLQEGSAGTPAFSFSNDTNTGLYQNGADTIALASGGTVELSITTATSTFSDGAVFDTSTLVVNANDNTIGIGTASPSTTVGIVGNIRANGTMTVTGNFSVTGATATFYPTANAANIFRVQDSAQSNILSVSTDGTVASTTAASSLIVDSTTLVANANENRVGVGTAGPTQLFSVGSASAFTISDAGNATTTANFTLNSRNPFIQWAPTSAGDKLSFQSGTTTIASLDIGGTWVTKGPQTANGSPDVAEYIATRALTAAELGNKNSSATRRVPGAGDVVAIDKLNKETAVLATKPYGKLTLGIIADGHSTFTSLAGLADNPNARPLALVGRVYVKVTAENGLIEAGDFLTVSATKPGYAMKATDRGYVIGKALESMQTGKETSILIFINNTYYPGE